MVRGLDRQVIFRDDTDRAEFVRRLAAIAESSGLCVFAWALLPNHAHLLVRTGQRSLARGMRALLTGYAGAFNRRHRRVGHLFQNRYRSILVEEEAYLLELVRYLHLNPLRAGIVKDLATLARYPWSGHSALLGHVERPWQAVAEALGQYGSRTKVARKHYQRFVAEGVGQGQRPELQGGGLVRSLGGWDRVRALRRGREAWAADERILGSSEFVERVWQETVAQARVPARTQALQSLPALLDRCATTFGVARAELISGSRRRVVAHSRAVASCLAVRELGLPIAVVAREVGLSATAVRRSVVLGEALLAQRGLNLKPLLPQQKK
jgi:REP element-mobilizing transposase RayT